MALKEGLDTDGPESTPAIRTSGLCSLPVVEEAYAGEPIYPSDPMADALVQTQSFLAKADKIGRLEMVRSNDLTVQKPQDHRMPVYHKPV